MVMSNIQVVLRPNKKKKNDTIPLALRISENYKTNYYFLGHSILEKDWDETVEKSKKDPSKLQKAKLFSQQENYRSTRFVFSLRR